MTRSGTHRTRHRAALAVMSGVVVAALSGCVSLLVRHDWAGAAFAGCAALAAGLIVRLRVLVERQLAKDGS